MNVVVSMSFPSIDKKFGTALVLFQLSKHLGNGQNP